MKRCKGMGMDPAGEGVNVAVRVDVTKIVRYLCMAGVLIVGIIFGTRCYKEWKTEQ